MVCVVCSAPSLHGRVYSAPSYSVAGGLPRRGPFIAAARGSSMTLGGPHCTCMVTEIVPTGCMFSKRGVATKYRALYSSIAHGGTHLYM